MQLFTPAVVLGSKQPFFTTGHCFAKSVLYCANFASDMIYVVTCTQITQH